MADGNIGTQYNLKAPAPIVYLDLYVPRQGKSKTGALYEARYGVTYLLERNSEDHINIHNLVAGIAQAGGVSTPKSIPLRDGNNSEKYKAEFFRDKIVFVPHSNDVDKRTGLKRDPPRLFIVDNGEFVPLTRQEAELRRCFYPGVMAGGQFGFSMYEGNVTAYINEVYSMGYGDRIADKFSDPKANNESLLKFAGRSSDINPLAARPAASSAVAPTAASTSQF